MRVAALDLGTNSFLCLIAEGVRGEVQPKILEDKIDITRLGEGVHLQRQFSKGALERAEAAFRIFLERIDHFNVEKVQAVATSAARDVRNAAALFELGARYGIPIQVITGAQEAQYTFDGATFGQVVTDETIVIDIGGGSTEVIYFDPSRLNHLLKHSFDIGAVRLTEMFVTAHPAPATELQKMDEYIERQLNLFKFNVRRPTLIAVGGTPTSLAAALQGPEVQAQDVDGAIMSVAQVSAFSEKLAGFSLALRAKYLGIGPRRADIIVAGARILEKTMSFLDSDQVRVSTKGLRYGLAKKLLQPED